MDQHNERPAIWEEVQTEMANLTVRKEKRTVTEWIAAVVNRVVSKHNIAGGSDDAVMWTEAMVLETWLTMSVQSERKLEAAGRKMAMMIASLVPNDDDSPPAEWEVVPAGVTVAMLLQEGNQGNGTIVTREAVELAKAGMTAGQPYSDNGKDEAGVFERIWLQEVDGKLAIMAWMKPHGESIPEGAPPGVALM